MDLRGKMQLKAGQTIEIVGAPDAAMGVLSELDVEGHANLAPALFVFVTDEAALTLRRDRIVKAATSNRLTWVAYPKAGQLGTDLNRDRLAALLIEHGVQPVRQVALDDVWSVLRFRPG